jgi:Cu2+-exporting ATPase
MLRPEIAALAMSGSSFLVAMNALLLKRLRLPGVAAQPASTTVAVEADAGTGSQQP